MYILRFLCQMILRNNFFFVYYYQILSSQHCKAQFPHLLHRIRRRSSFPKEVQRISQSVQERQFPMVPSLAKAPPHQPCHVPSEGSVNSTVDGLVVMYLLMHCRGILAKCTGRREHSSHAGHHASGHPPAGWQWEGQWPVQPPQQLHLWKICWKVCLFTAFFYLICYSQLLDV